MKVIDVRDLNQAESIMKFKGFIDRGYDCDLAGGQDTGNPHEIWIHNWDKE